MCISPIKLPDNQLAGCRKCWQCQARRVDDWVGRCLAESRTADKTHSITLTYGRDEAGDAEHIRAIILTYSDVQKWFKRLRREGYKFRYLCVGEYGARKGRAHWHLIVFWYGRTPPFVLAKQKAEQPHWDHGFGFVEEIRGATDISQAKAVRYVCKYLQKDEKDPEKMGRFHMSKKPPLGAEYFKRLAARYVESGLAPQDLHYAFPGVVDRKGRKKQFMMTGKTAENFLSEFVAGWLTIRRDWIPASELVEEYQNTLVEDDALFHLLLERTGSVIEAAKKVEHFERGVEQRRVEAQFGPVECWFGASNTMAKTTAGKYIQRHTATVKRGVDLTRSRRAKEVPAQYLGASNSYSQHNAIPDKSTS